jgi:hypothetical protein
MSIDLRDLVTVTGGDSHCALGVGLMTGYGIVPGALTGWLMAGRRASGAGVKPGAVVGALVGAGGGYSSADCFDVRQRVGNKG